MARICRWTLLWSMRGKDELSDGMKREQPKDVSVLIKKNNGCHRAEHLTGEEMDATQRLNDFSQGHINNSDAFGIQIQVCILSTTPRCARGQPSRSHALLFQWRRCRHFRDAGSLRGSLWIPGLMSSLSSHIHGWMCIICIVVFCVCKRKLPVIGFLNRNVYYQECSA